MPPRFNVAKKSEGDIRPFRVDDDPLQLVKDADGSGIALVELAHAAKNTANAASAVKKGRVRFIINSLSFIRIPAGHGLVYLYGYTGIPQSATGPQRGPEIFK
ncbi:MAG: hypothetical protein LBD58_05010 [Treponema sp.]|nr:hypothetical protein [Treponema sp.]